MKTKLLLSIALPVAMAWAGPVFAGSDDVKVQWADVPAAVQKTITDHAEDGKVEKIEKETKTKDGQKVVIYEADVRTPDGKKIEIEVREDGKLLEFEYD